MRSTQKHPPSPLGVSCCRPRNQAGVSLHFHLPDGWLTLPAVRHTVSEPLTYLFIFRIGITFASLNVQKVQMGIQENILLAHPPPAPWMLSSDGFTASPAACPLRTISACIKPAADAAARGSCINRSLLHSPSRPCGLSPVLPGRSVRAELFPFIAVAVLCMFVSFPATVGLAGS